MCRNTKFIWSVDHAGYLTSERSERVKYPCQHEKKSLYFQAFLYYSVNLFINSTRNTCMQQPLALIRGNKKDGGLSILP